jgi:parallel beta-helix repeat protein
MPRTLTAGSGIGLTDDGSLITIASRFTQSGTGAVARNTQDKLREFVSVVDFGAEVSPSSATAAFQAAADSGAKRILVPAGAWLTNRVDWPAGVEVVLDQGASIAPASVITGPLWYFTGRGGSITGGTFNVNRTTYPLLVPIYLDVCSYFRVSRVKIDEAGRFGVYLINCKNCVIEENEIQKAAQSGIVVEGTTQADSRFNVVQKNKVNDVSTQHGIQVLSGADNEVAGNEVSNTTGFGINGNKTTRLTIARNVVYDTVIEGINLDETDTSRVIGNHVYWSGSASTDFGISVYGPSGTQTANFNSVQANTITGSYKAGIALADYVGYTRVDGNTVINPNAENLAGGAAVQIYGTNCQQNVVQGNLLIDFASKMRYGIAESNFSGTGSPANNRLIDNMIRGEVTAKVLAVGTTENVGNAN